MFLTVNILCCQAEPCLPEAAGLVPLDLCRRAAPARPADQTSCKCSAAGPVQVIKLVHRCWEFQPERRPTMIACCQELDQILDEMGRRRRTS